VFSPNRVSTPFLVVALLVLEEIYIRFPFFRCTVPISPSVLTLSHLLKDSRWVNLREVTPRCND